MRKGGVLEGFPAFLFGSCNCDAPTLVIDRPELGRLNLSPIPGDRRMKIVVSSNKEWLENSREVISELEGGDIQLVQAAQKQFPFRDASIGTILTLTSGNPDADQVSSEEATGAASDMEFARILSDDSTLVEIAPGRTTRNRAIKLWPKSEYYIVRPSSGSHYFVSGDGAPTSDLLAQFHHGRLRSLRIKTNILLSRSRKISLSDDVCIAIYAPTLCQTFIDRLAPLKEKNELDAFPKLDSTNSLGLFVKVGWNVLLLFGNQDGMITKLPLSTDVLTKMESNADTLTALQNIDDPALRSVLPEVVGKGTICDQAFWIEKRIEGTPATKLWWKPASRRQAVEATVKFLVKLHQSSARPVMMDRQLFDALTRHYIESVEERVKNRDPGFNLATFHEALWAFFQARHIPLVRTHGDLWQGNLLISEDMKLVGVLDWDLSKKDGWPLIDLMHLLTFQQKWLAVWHFGRLVTWKLLPRRLTKWETVMVTEYCTSISIEDDLWPGFVALYWLQRAAQVVEVFDHAWFQRNVVNPLPKIVESISVT